MNDELLVVPNAEETTETTQSIITPDDVYTVKVYKVPELATLYFVAIGGVLFAGALVHLFIRYVGRYRT